MKTIEQKIAERTERIKELIKKCEGIVNDYGIMSAKYADKIKESNQIITHRLPV